MKIADPHHHLWDLKNHYYPWLIDEPMHQMVFGDYTAIRRNYEVKDLLADAAGLDLQRSVHIQTDFEPGNPVGETAWLQSCADAPGSRGFPHGIVGFCNFAEPGAEAILAGHAQYPNFRGIRHLLNLHDDPVLRFTTVDYLNDADWCRNYRLLAKYGASYDLQVYYPQMADAARLAGEAPDITMIVNHAGMPHERTPEGIDAWREGMRALAARDNTAAKISGLAMLDHTWTANSIRPFVLDVIDIFGTDRCMFASNFPVDKLFSTYSAVWSAFDEITKDFSDAERTKLFHDNAVSYYRL